MFSFLVVDRLLLFYRVLFLLSEIDLDLIIGIFGTLVNTSAELEI